MEPVEFRCAACKKEHGDFAPVLALARPMDPEVDEEWNHVVITRPLRGGSRHVDQLSRQRRSWWMANGRPSVTNPGTLLQKRTRFVDVAGVDVSAQTVIGAKWDGVIDLRCPKCSDVPRQLTVRAMVEGARHIATRRLRHWSIYV
jgi:hypothetical protein